MREVVERAKGGDVVIGGQRITSMRFADDEAMIAQTK